MVKRYKFLIPLLLCILVQTIMSFASVCLAESDPQTQDNSKEAEVSRAEEHAARQPDYSRKGSITLDILLADGTAVGGGSLRAYLVAEARSDDGNNDFVYVEPFGEEGEIVDADTISNAEEGAPELAAALAQKAGETDGVQVEVDQNGTAVFTDLALGLYLIVQDIPATGFEPIRSFLVTVPMWDGEKLIYDVNANPKPSISYERPALEIPAEKIVVSDGGKPDPAEVYIFTLTPADPDDPMPDHQGGSKDEKTGAITVKRTGAGTVSFGEIRFGLDDVGKTYTYTAEEIPGQDTHCTYETRSYTFTVSVTMEEGVIRLSTSCVCSDNSIVETMTFINRYKEDPPPPPELPDTGQNWSLVYALGGLGVILCAAGWYLNKKERNL